MFSPWSKCDQCGRKQPGTPPFICDQCRASQMRDDRDPKENRREREWRRATR